MRYIPKPEPIEGADPDGNPLKFGLDEFVTFLIDSDTPRFGSDGVGVRSSWRIEAAIKAHKDLPYLALEDADQALVHQSAENPSKGYPGTPARNFRRFIDAIADARTDPPAA